MRLRGSVLYWFAGVFKDLQMLMTFSAVFFQLYCDTTLSYTLFAQVFVFSGFSMAARRASWMVSGLLFCSMTPYSRFGINSLAPPTSVITGIALQAAASSREVEKPSEREGRQKIFAC